MPNLCHCLPRLYIIELFETFVLYQDNTLAVGQVEDSQRTVMSGDLPSTTVLKVAAIL